MDQPSVEQQMRSLTNHIKTTKHQKAIKNVLGTNNTTNNNQTNDMIQQKVTSPTIQTNLNATEITPSLCISRLFISVTHCFFF